MQPPPPPSAKVDRQREHQANERTFLAWLRTAIALIAFGLTIARFGYLLYELQGTVQATPLYTPVFQSPLTSSQVLGTGLIGLGITLIGFALWQYNRVFWQIEQANYQPDRLVIWVTAGLVLILGLLSLPFVLWRPLPSPPPASPPTSFQSRGEYWRAHHPPDTWSNRLARLWRTSPWC
jgi:putative membrane protein